MATDDFSFPTHKFPCTIDSPPLWCLSPAASSKAEDPHNELEEEEEEEEEEEIIATNINYCNKGRKSFSHEERAAKMDEKEDEESSFQDDHKEEKMDMLWDGFNEELTSTTTTTSDYSDMFSREMLQLGCVRAFKLSKTHHGGDHRALSTRKPSVVAIMKVLKRLFFLHSSHHKLKKPAAW